MSYRADLAYVQRTQRQKFQVKPQLKTTSKPLAYNTTKAYYAKGGKAGKVYDAKIYVPKKYHQTEMGRLMRIHELRENLASQTVYSTPKGGHRKAMHYFKKDIKYVKH